MKNAIQIAVLMPHAPVLVPELAGIRADQVARSIDAMRSIARRVVNRQPAAVVVVSPHSPRRERAFGVWTPELHQGSLRRFGAPELTVELPNDGALIAGLMTAADECGVNLWFIDDGDEDLDHGAVVPLWFLQEAGWRGPTVILGLQNAANGRLAKLGSAIARAAARRGGAVALIASGDMSHRLKPDAPCGYHPDARIFDDEFIRLVNTGDAQGLMHFDAGLRGLAGEDVVDSTVVALAAVACDMHGHQVLSYEGPFGVGYGVALLHEHEAIQRGDLLFATAALPRVARRSVESALGLCEATCPEPPSGAACEPAPVFVTLRTLDGELRGCVGTITPRRANVVEETWFNARAAAFEDTRFAPLQEHEIGGISFEVSVLRSFEDVRDVAEIDPRIHGVIVSASGGRRGLLLPGIEGVETAAQQIAIARRKGLIEADEPVCLRRFLVDKYQETQAATP